VRRFNSALQLRWREVSLAGAGAFLGMGLCFGLRAHRGGEHSLEVSDPEEPSSSASEESAAELALAITATSR